MVHVLHDAVRYLHSVHAASREVHDRQSYEMSTNVFLQIVSLIQRFHCRELTKVFHVELKGFLECFVMQSYNLLIYLFHTTWATHFEHLNRRKTNTLTLDNSLQW